MSITIPVIFFGVAAFLLNNALGRLVAAQREQIAALKALGFATGTLTQHYLKLVVVIVLIGSTLGIAGGFGFGEAMMASYHGFFRLPDLPFVLTTWSVMAGFAISLAAGSLGVLTALQEVIRLAPAVAMRPAAPPGFRRSFIEAFVPGRAIKARWMMMLRNIAGRPSRSVLPVVGIAFAVPMMALGIFWRDAIDEMIDLQFHLVERGNAAITFPQPKDRAIIRDLARLPGVLAVEGQRIVPVRLRAGQRSYLTSVIGLSTADELRRPHDAALCPIAASPDGITLTRRLAERLDMNPGDLITVETMEGRRRKRELPVIATVDESIGMVSYMDIETLNRLTGEGAVVSAASLCVEPTALPALARSFKNLPTIESVSMKAYTLSSFLDKIAGLVFVSAGILTVFASIIAVGVVYNSARVSLQERAWELASLRVLGFTRGEVASILFGEFAIEIALGIPIGLWLSHCIIGLIAKFHSNESFQIPPVIEPRTYLIAAGVVLAAAAVVVWAMMPGPVLVETAVVAKGRFVASVDADGKTRVRERYVVAAPLVGRLGRIRFKVGDPIKVDDAVATITPSPAPLMDPRTRNEIEGRLGAAEANVERAKAGVERARAQSDQASADLARTRTLAERGTATAQALEHAELAVRLADRDLRAMEFLDHAAEHELSQMRALLTRYGSNTNTDKSPESWSVAAPVAGVVLKVTQESETIVQPGTMLLDIGDPRDLEVVVDALSTDAVEILPGADVTIVHWGGDGTLSGRVRRVEPTAFTKVSTLGVEEQRVNVLIDVTSPPERWARLGDAYQIDARIVVFTREDATIVPTGARSDAGINGMFMS